MSISYSPSFSVFTHNFVSEIYFLYTLVATFIDSPMCNRQKDGVILAQCFGQL